jgi:hypothetical protein
VEHTSDVKALIAKWDDYIPETAPACRCAHLNRKRAPAIAKLLESQSRYWSHLDDSNKQVFVDCLGEQWEETVHRAYAIALSRADVFEWSGVQPMVGPVSGVHFLVTIPVKAKAAVDQLADLAGEQLEESDEAPDVRLDLQTKEVKAATRRTRARLSQLSDHITVWGTSILDELVAIVFDEALLDVRRELIGTCMATCDPYVVDVDEVDDTIHRAMLMIHRTTHRGPPNRIICHPDWAPTVRKWTNTGMGYMALTVDPAFPKNKLFLARIGPSVIDVPVVYAPFVMSFMQAPLTEEDHRQMMLSFMHTPRDKALAVCLRHAIEVVDPNGFQLIEVRT